MAEVQHSFYSILKDYKKTKDPKACMSLIQRLSETPLNSNLCKEWFSEFRNAVSFLNKETEFLVTASLNVPWQYGDLDVEIQLRNFVISLVLCKSYFLTPVLETLFKKLIPEISEVNEELLNINPFQWKEENHIANLKVLSVIQTITAHVPLSTNLVIQVASKSCPYFKRHTHQMVAYVYNLLHLGQLLPHLRKNIYEIIFSIVLKLDLNCNRQDLYEDDFDDCDSEDMFQMDDCEFEKREEVNAMMTDPVAHSLDSVMTLLLRYVHLMAHGASSDLTRIMSTPHSVPFKVNGCVAGSASIVALSCSNGEGKKDLNFEYDEEKSAYWREVTAGCGCGSAGRDGDGDAATSLRSLYLDLRSTFTSTVLRSHASDHVQFIIFYVIAIRPTLLADFLDLLLNAATLKGGVSLEERQVSISYLSSLLARGKFVRFSHVHYCLEILAQWCKTYLRNCNIETSDLKAHRHFYCVSEGLFYVFTFHYREYTQSKARLKLAQALHLNEIVSHPLNPLRFCNPKLASFMGAISSYYQLAYWNSELDPNVRGLPVASEDLDGVLYVHLSLVYPFDPYLLKRSEPLIRNHYCKFEDLPKEVMNATRTTSSDVYHKAATEAASPGSMEFSFELSPVAF